MRCRAELDVQFHEYCLRQLSSFTLSLCTLCNEINITLTNCQKKIIPLFTNVYYSFDLNVWNSFYHNIYSYCVSKEQIVDDAGWLAGLTYQYHQRAHSLIQLLQSGSLYLLLFATRKRMQFFNNIIAFVSSTPLLSAALNKSIFVVVQVPFRSVRKVKKSNKLTPHVLISLQASPRDLGEQNMGQIKNSVWII